MEKALRRNQNRLSGQRILTTLVLLAGLFVSGCASRTGANSSGKADPRITTLADSVEPLREQFNADKDKLRVLALFSPT
jgi:hypothetical protein